MNKLEQMRDEAQIAKCEMVKAQYRLNIEERKEDIIRMEKDLVSQEELIATTKQKIADRNKGVKV